MTDVNLVNTDLVAGALLDYGYEDDDQVYDYPRMDDADEPNDADIIAGGNASDETSDLNLCYYYMTHKLIYNYHLSKSLESVLKDNKLWVSVIRNTINYKIYRDNVEILIAQHKTNLGNPANFSIDKVTMSSMKKQARRIRVPNSEYRKMFRDAKRKNYALSTILCNEQLLLSENRCMYHGTSLIMYMYMLFNHIILQIYNNNHTCRDINSLTFRYSTDVQSIQNLLDFKAKYPVDKFINFNDTVDESKGEWNDILNSLKSYLISTNLFLYGNYKNPGECSASYYITPLSHTTIEFALGLIKKKAETVFSDKAKTTNVNKHILIFMDKIKLLHKKYNNIVGDTVLLLIAFPNSDGLINKNSYFSLPGGLYLDMDPSLIYDLLNDKKYDEIYNQFILSFKRLEKNYPVVYNRNKYFFTNKDGSYHSRDKLLTSLQLRVLFTEELLQSTAFTMETISPNLKVELIYILSKLINETVVNIRGSN